MQTQTLNPAQRAKAIDTALERIDKMYGKGTVMKMDASAIVDVPVIPTGCLSVDLALGTGGVPRGRVVEVYGPESSGKTTLTLHLIAQAQKAGGVCAFIDAEHALDAVYAGKLGVDVPSLLVSQPDSGEQALEITDTLVRTAGLDLIVIDSVAALTPRAEIEGDMGDSHVGLQARLMSQALRKLTAAAARTGTTIVFINQLRMKIGVMFGSPEVTTGGNALKFYSSVRIDIRRIGAIKHGDSVVGNKTRVKIVKNKVAPPFRQAEVEIRFGYGLDQAMDLIEQGGNLGLITRSGAWYTWGETRVQGKEALRDLLLSDEGLSDRLRLEVLDKLGLTPKAPATVAEA
ncbi:MAG: recombinase RecA [Proteobacteria bacterium]|nr:recombinase RecA [Pseudomonadota bacterium]